VKLAVIKMVGCNKLNQKGKKRVVIDKQKPHRKPGRENELQD
jgi:hypothetical protein